jgi:hypothetical protein
MADRGGIRLIFFEPVGQRREPLAPEELHARHQRRDGAAHGVRAQEQRLVQAARAQQAVGEDMPALGVGAKLDLVHRDEIGADLQRHRLDGADPVLRAVGHDAFLARHQRHDRRAAQCATMRS